MPEQLALAGVDVGGVRDAARARDAGPRLVVDARIVGVFGVEVGGGCFGQIVECGLHVGIFRELVVGLADGLGERVQGVFRSGLRETQRDIGHFRALVGRCNRRDRRDAIAVAEVVDQRAGVEAAHRVGDDVDFLGARLLERDVDALGEEGGAIFCRRDRRHRAEKDLVTVFA